MAQPLCINQNILIGEYRRLIGLDRCQIIKVFTHHGSHQFYTRQIRYRIFANQLPVTQNGNPVADCINLLQKVGNKYDAYSFFLQLIHQLE